MADPFPTRATIQASIAGAPWAGTARYEVLGCLGRGGMGIVYEVFDRQNHERVALKTLQHFDAGGLYRFKKEFRTLADVVHPNLVHLHELVADEHDELFFTMELVEGNDFLAHVHGRSSRDASGTSGIDEAVDESVRRVRTADERSRALEPDLTPRPGSPADYERLRPALRQLVEGVQALHEAGKLHRDLKPSNVRVTPEGRVVVLDFGVATELKRRPRGGAAGGEDGDEEIVGTAVYMAPEQASGEPPVAASDWYSVGALLYEAMVGRPPFDGESLEVLTAKLTTTPVAPSACVDGVPDDLDALCMMLLSVEPEGRPAGRDILRRLGASTSDQAPAPSLAPNSATAVLVGREEQFRALEDAFQATREGRAVAVRVAGLSGLGKSSVVNQFLDGLERRGDVLVLRGRAYEREAVPYKAVDSIIDALTRHLIEQQGDPSGAAGAPLALPAGIGALAHLFPVLRRVESIDDVPRETGDLLLLRQRAFGVLRELFASLAQRQSVVVFIDDVQWGDSDSAALLVDLVRPPAAPPILLVTTHRAEDEATSPFLADLRERWPSNAEVRDVVVGPLALEDARRMALGLLGADGASARETAEEIASESHGSPFLLEELSRAASTYHRVAMGDTLSPRVSVSLEQILGARAARLPEDARRFLEVIAVGGRPLAVATVGVAANAADSATRLVAVLRARRFVRSSLRNGCEMVEASHDRVRETIVAHLPPEVTREHHAQLARVLEATPDSDPEAIASHLSGAGDGDRAAHYAERAAEQAIAKLAFAQAARLFQLTLETMTSAARSSPDGRRLARRMAEACEWAGHAEKAARAYLEAAEGATPLERVDLERAAAAQLIAAGQIDESAVVCRRVLAAVGRKVPGSVLTTIFWVVVYRIVATLLLGSKLRDPKPLSAEHRVRLGALHAIGRGLAVVDPISAMYVKARHLVDALRSGNRAHIVLAAAAEASSLAAGGGAVGKRERTLFELARTLSEETGDLEGRALYQITYGVCEYLRGHWRSSLNRLDAVGAKLLAMRRWQANGNVFAVYALTYLGDLREVGARTTALLVDAARRGDLYTTVNLRASHPMAAWLAADDVEGARGHLRESMAHWSKTRFLVQHWQSMLWEAEVDLYAGDGPRAWDRLARDARSLRRSHLFSVQLIEVLTHFARGRSAVASLHVLGDAARAQRLEGAVRALRAIERVHLPWTDAIAAALAATIARASGEGDVERLLERAIERADAAEMALHAEAARHRLALLRGGDSGRAAALEAERVMAARGVRNPERYANALFPGTWRTPS